MHRRKKVDEKSCVTFLTPAGTSNELDVQNEWDENTHTHTGGKSHRISPPPPFCGACLNFSREKDSAIPFPRGP